MPHFIRMTDLDLKGKRVFIRADLNVPVKDGRVTSDARITASMPTVAHCLKAGARVMVTSHLGRPEEGVYSEENSLEPVAAVMSAKLGKPVRVVKDWVDGGSWVNEVAPGEVVLLENLRFHLEEEGKVKVKNASNGLANPNARFQKSVSVEDVLASPMFADPLHHTVIDLARQ